METERGDAGSVLLVSSGFSFVLPDAVANGTISMNLSWWGCSCYCPECSGVDCGGC